MAKDRLDRIEKLVESNAKSIQALTDDLSEMKRDRDTMYQLMSDLTGKMAILTNAQAQSYQTIKSLDRRQDQLTSQQQQLIDIIKSIIDK